MPTTKQTSVDSYDTVGQCTVGSDDFILVDEIDGDRKMSTIETIQEIRPWLKHKMRSTVALKNIRRRLPILEWLPRYTAEDALGDMVSGVTVGLTVIPQSMAYAGLAGLPPQFGLYGSFLGALVYTFFGSCKDVPMGPTAIVALMTYNTLHGHGPVYATLLCFLTGVIQLSMAACGLGILIDFVSGPVSSGFTSAVALLIITSQIKDLVGIKATGTTLFEMVVSLYKDIHNASTADAAIGFGCIALLLALRIVAETRIGPAEPERQTCKHKFVNRILWLVGSFRNSIIVVGCTALSYVHIISLDESTVPSYKIIGDIPAGLPDFDVPKFSVQNGNGTVGFVEMVSTMGSGIVVLPLIGLLESISICKAFANGKTVDATQELLAIGLCNIGNAFVHSFPGGGSFSRSAVNNASGVRTPLGGLYTALLVAVALQFLTPNFYYIPKSSMAAVIIAAVVFMVEVRVVKPIYRSKKSDLIPGLSTFVACLLLPLEIGVLVGIGLNLMSILYHAARPKISIQIHNSRAGVKYLMLTPDRCLVFPSADYVRNLVTKHSLKRDMPVVIDCSHVYGADFTAAKVIEMLSQDFSNRGQALFFYNLKPSVVEVFKGVQPKDFVLYYHKKELDRLLAKRAARDVTALQPLLEML
ncbi:sodium-independent sulfate anion transporter-like [Adelges cooleyi]|uniref:sodium-independent sulfate anion transporter-like n=1 Tax=Adelges cooleyi TaxID=133065 RepID=UPI00217F6D60|nr:sodium-independent sulfate anion transporter-like [Adelges cooleyi]XP_050432122.1 sodium-independent sulfate anion transporter-like [Adelges cooleyi]XP_050432123.1 sodium-independent sulfate anion transporter-like [Adelges cooleyi]XP_050432124.1 sodium-independent sulfate anion transporter-like [Adelges cooleyi]XP_050432125.1 sodium-independent sulfate anion transporter-like [Adelges cooleyi]XP_050432126.1 sodium-independent sulfate anion transporter-like [Adelges cooleyi]XP_050432127.1 so